MQQGVEGSVPVAYSTHGAGRLNVAEFFHDFETTKIIKRSVMVDLQPQNDGLSTVQFDDNEVIRALPEGTK